MQKEPLPQIEKIIYVRGLMTFIFTHITNWYRRQPTEGKVSAIFMAGILIFVIGLAISGLIKRQQLQQSGVFYAARIDKISSSKSGSHYYISYNYGTQTYTGSFKPGFGFKPNREDAYIYIQFLPENPSVFQYLDEGEVLDSVLNKMPVSGWRSLPDVPRQYLLKGNYI